MITDPTELSELRSTTADLIEHSSSQIVLTRSGWERTPSGGTRPISPTNLAPQTLYFGAVTTDPNYVSRDEGEHVFARHVLVGMPDADIEEKDTFKIGNRKFEVLSLHPDRSYETRAWVTERA